MAARWAAAIVFTLGAVNAAAPQVSRPAGTLVTIAGRVVDAESGAPLPNARLTGALKAVGTPVALSDDEGRFTLTLPSDRRDLAVFKSGYARQTVRVSGGNSLTIRLDRTVAISGRVTDQTGEPLIGIRVSIFRLGGPSQQAMIDAAQATTDDRGEYRAGGLAADTFTVGIEGSAVDQAREMFYPGVERLTLRPGEERGGIDIAVPVPDRTGPPPYVVTKAPGAIGRGLVRGRVMTGNGQPVPGAVVTLGFMTSLRSASWGENATADASGRFEFRQLPPGRFLILAQKSGYDMPSSATPDRLPFVTLADGQTQEGITLRLNRWSSVEGRVLDERGDPIEGAVVQLLRPRYEDGRKALLPAGPSSVRTDDRGFYRFFKVPDGRYLLSATVGTLSSPELPGYPRTFFPGTPDYVAAQPLTVTSGVELRDVSLAMVRAKTYRVSGQLLDALGQPRVGGTLVLIPDEGEVIGITAGARIDADGSFEFVNVQPGRYVVQMSRGVVAGRREGDFAAVPISVEDADITGLVVQALAGSTIAGTITFNSARGAQPSGGWLQLSAVPVNPLQAPYPLAAAQIDRNWNFVLEGITGTRRLQATRQSEGWAVEAIRVNGQDALDKPMSFAGQPLKDVEIVLTDRVSVLSGTVAGNSVPTVRATVVIFSTDRSHWYHGSRYVRRLTSDNEGRFTVSGLPGGDYFAAAIAAPPPESQDAWEDPEFLASLGSQAARVVLTEGTTSTVRLEILPLRP